MSKDTQFAGSAIQLWKQIERYIDWRMEGASEEDIQRVIANYAYDLVLHSVREVDPFLLESKYTEDEQIMNQIPDLTTWPEETKQ